MSPPRPHLLVIRRRYLGDIVLLGSVLRNLRLHWPDAHLSVLVESAYAPVLALNPDVDTALVLPSRWRDWLGFLHRLRGARYTHVFDFDNTDKTAALARLSGAPFRLALHHGGYPLKWRALYTHAVHNPDETHETQPITEYYLRALGPAGVPVVTREVRLVPRSEDVAALRHRVGATGRVLLVHPGSRSAFRLWPAENFALVCDRAQDELGVQVVLAGGPAERPLLDAIRGHARMHLLTFDEPLSLPRFAALASLSTVLLCHDSGPMHVAAATGTRVVAIYGSQNAALFRPLGDGHTLLQPPLPCTACVAPGRCVPADSYRNFCVRNVTVDRVFSAIRAALAQPR